MKKPLALSRRALLVHIEITGWTGRIRDKRMAAAAERAIGLEPGVGIYLKRLIPQEAANNVIAQQAMARRALFAITLPWEESVRILPVDNWGRWQEVLAEQQRAYAETVGLFLRDYGGYIAKARKQLGVNFDARDYPPQEEMARRYRLEVRYDPLPASTHIDVVSIPDAAQRSIRQGVDRFAEGRVRLAIADLADRVVAVLLTVQEQLKTTAGQTRGVYGVRTQTWMLLRETVDLMPPLNVTGDKMLTKVYKSLSDLVKQEPSEMRAPGPARDHAISTVQAALEDLQRGG